MARKNRTYFTNRSMTPKGRQSTFFGDKAYSRFEGGGFTVRYSVCQKNKQDRLKVEVDVDGHGTVSSFTSFARLTPGPETAKVHAAVAFRKHFGVKGEPHDFAKAPACTCFHAL